MSKTPLRRYLHGSSRCWAIVTGATSGMGEEFAYQLAGLGFNIILHGRNEAKSNSVAKRIKSRYEGIEVDIAIVDAGSFPVNVDPIIDLVNEKQRKVTILVNNVGVVSQNYPLLEEEQPEQLSSQIITNTIFPTILASQILPCLKSNQPSLMINMASLGAWAPTPFLSPYSGAKAFIVNFSRSLANEMMSEKVDVDIVCLAPGQVVSGMNEGPETIMMPTSKVWVKRALDSLSPRMWAKRPNCVMVPYSPHNWAAKAMAWMPRSLADKTVSNVTKDLKKKKLASGGNSQSQSSPSLADRVTSDDRQ